MPEKVGNRPAVTKRKAEGGYDSMKKLTRMVYGIFLILALSGCAQNQASPSPAADAKSSAYLESLDLQDYDGLYESYLKPMYHSTILADGWHTAMEIDPDRLIDYYAYYNFFNDPDKESSLPGFLGSELEPYIQQYFDLPVEHLRTAPRYDAESQIYLCEGIGGAGSRKTVAARVEQNILEIDFVVLSAADESVITGGGTLKIKFEGEAYQYLSCTSWWDTPKEQ